MNINFNPAITFKGVYAVAGNQEELKDIDDAISQKLKFDYGKGGNDKLSNYNGLHILPKNTEPVSAMLVATNEDAKPLVEFVGSVYQKYNYITYAKHTLPYKESSLQIQAAFRDNPDPYLDYISKKNPVIKGAPIDEAKTFMKHYAFGTGRQLSDIKKLQAADILEAISKNCFDYVNGIIKSVKK